MVHVVHVVTCSDVARVFAVRTGTGGLHVHVIYTGVSKFPPSPARVVHEESTIVAARGCREERERTCLVPLAFPCAHQSKGNKVGTCRHAEQGDCGSSLRTP